jgi:prepilin-type N-terminal cleavage/methylation domain-containing protein
MRKNCTGFSLMESLICLLVLSVGMLGLGQLQAHLWTHAGDLQRLETARLIASNVTELVEIINIFTTQTAFPEAYPTPEPPAGFTYQKSTTPEGPLLLSEVTVFWTGPSGKDSFTAESTLYTAFETADVLCLLPDTPE